MAQQITPELQRMLLGQVGLISQLPVPNIPPAHSPAYAKLIRQGAIPMPNPGTTEYLDFAQANPGMIDLGGTKAQPEAPAETSYNPFQILADLLGRK